LPCTQFFDWDRTYGFQTRKSAGIGKVVKAELWVGCTFCGIEPWIDSNKVGRNAVESRGTFPAVFDLKIEILDGHDFS
jgi:hypothetical protein